MGLPFFGVATVWLLLWFVELGQVPGVRVFERPVLNTLRNNRLTIFSAWATVAMARERPSARAARREGRAVGTGQRL